MGIKYIQITLHLCKLLQRRSYGTCLIPRGGASLKDKAAHSHTSCLDGTLFTWMGAAPLTGFWGGNLSAAQFSEAHGSSLSTQQLWDWGLPNIFKGPQRALRLANHFASINRAVLPAQMPVKFVSPPIESFFAKCSLAGQDALVTQGHLVFYDLICQFGQKLVIGMGRGGSKWGQEMGQDSCCV